MVTELSVVLMVHISKRIEKLIASMFVIQVLNRSCIIAILRLA